MRSIIAGGASTAARAAPRRSGRPSPALVNQRRVAGGLPTLGFANPKLYAIGVSSRYASDFHDIADGSDNLYYQAVGGYDDATGWGSFNGANLLADLSAAASHNLIWENSVSNDVVSWQFNGVADTGNRTYLSQDIPLDWHIVGSADITGNGYPALIWQNRVSGDVVYWQFNGTTHTATGFLSQGIPPDWKVVAVADITGDGKPDLIWQNSLNGNVVYWQMNGTQFVNSGFLSYGAQVGPEWKVVAVADVTGDGEPDLIWQNSVNGSVVYWQMNGTQYVSNGFLAQGVSSLFRVVGLQ